MPRTRTLQPATHPATAPAAATMTALSNPDGALPGGPRRALPSSRASKRRIASPVVVVQPGIGPWKCDACPATGTGGIQLLAHAGATGHRRYSPKAGR